MLGEGIQYFLQKHEDEQRILEQFDTKDLEVFNRFQQIKKKSQDLEPNKYVVGLRACPIAARHLKQTFDQIDQLKTSELYNLAVACCIELHAYQIFQKYYKETIEFGKEWDILPKNGVRIIRYQCNTSAGAAFFFRFLGRYEPGETVNVFSVEKINILKKAMESDNAEIRELGSTLYASHKVKFVKNQSTNALLALRESLNPLNEEIRRNTSLKNQIRGFSSFIQALNFTNQLLKRELQDLLPEYEEPWCLKLPQEKQEEILAILSDANEEVKDRLTQFLNIQARLTELRNKQTRGKLEFMKQYMQHPYSFLTVQIQAYQSMHQSYFSVPDAPKEKKIVSSPIRQKKSKMLPVVKKGPVNKKKEIQKKQSTEISTNTSKAQPKVKKVKIVPIRKAASIVKPPVVTKKKMGFCEGYADRVEEWFQDEPAHLEKKSYRHLSSKIQAQHIIRHAFAREVEDYAGDYGFEKPYPNTLTGHQDRLICIPGEIHFYQGGEGIVERGVFNFCIGEDGKMYHRHFSKREDTEIFECAKDAFYLYDYPSLQESQAAAMKKSPRRSREVVLNPEVEVEKDELTEAITIRDLKRKATYVLFKTGSL